MIRKVEISFDFLEYRFHNKPYLRLRRKEKFKTVI